MFGKELVGRKFRTGEVDFKVLEIKPYSNRLVSDRYKKILAFREGFLVAVGFRGTLIPNITLKGGVARLTKIEINGQVFDRPKAISAALGIKEAMQPYELR